MSTEKSKAKSTARYDGPTRRKIKARIRALYKEGMGYGTITPVLIAEGFTAPDGSELKQTTVCSQGKAAGIRIRRGAQNRLRPSHVNQTPTTADHDQGEMVDLIFAAKLSDNTKIRMVKALLGKS